MQLLHTNEIPPQRLCWVRIMKTLVPCGSNWRTIVRIRVKVLKSALLYSHNLLIICDSFIKWVMIKNQDSYPSTWITKVCLGSYNLVITRSIPIAVSILWTMSRMASLRGLYCPSSTTANFSPVLSNHGRSSSAPPWTLYNCKLLNKSFY